MPASLPRVINCVLHIQIAADFLFTYRMSDKLNGL